jgi:hypothetical protein
MEHMERPWHSTWEAYSSPNGDSMSYIVSENHSSQVETIGTSDNSLPAYEPVTTWLQGGSGSTIGSASGYQDIYWSSIYVRAKPFHDSAWGAVVEITSLKRSWPLDVDLRYPVIRGQRPSTLELAYQRKANYGFHVTGLTYAFDSIDNRIRLVHLALPTISSVTLNDTAGSASPNHSMAPQVPTGRFAPTFDEPIVSISDTSSPRRIKRWECNASDSRVTVNFSHWISSEVSLSDLANMRFSVGDFIITDSLGVSTGLDQPTGGLLTPSRGKADMAMLMRTKDVHVAHDSITVEFFRIISSQDSGQVIAALDSGKHLDFITEVIDSATNSAIVTIDQYGITGGGGDHVPPPGTKSVPVTGVRGKTIHLRTRIDTSAYPLPASYIGVDVNCEQNISTAYGAGALPKTVAPRQRGALPTVDILHAFPDPASGGFSTVEYRTMQQGFVTVEIFDYIGKYRRTLTAARLAPGVYRSSFDTRDLPPGVYCLEVKVDGVQTARGTVTVIR